MDLLAKKDERERKEQERIQRERMEREEKERKEREEVKKLLETEAFAVRTQAYCYMWIKK